MLNYELEKRAQSSYTPLEVTYNGYNLHVAGLPGFPRIFFRDGVIAARLKKDSGMMREFLKFGADTQGLKNDPYTHEQSGAIFHEIDPLTGKGFVMPDHNNLSTQYNSCDSAAEFLKGHEEYLRWTGDAALSEHYKTHIIRAADYITRHVNPDGHYEEDPKFSGATKTALKVTYWRDSDIPGRANGVPAFPVVYTLAHIQNMEGLRSASRILKLKGEDEFSQTYQSIGEKMKDALPSLFDTKKDTFYIAKDSLGFISGYSTDSLHALSYLAKDDIPQDYMRKILETSEKLETPYGYRVLDHETALHVEDPYHAKTVWTHEQGVIHMGAKRHFNWSVKQGNAELAEKFQHVMDISSRVSRYLCDNAGSLPELRMAETGEARGCDPQLWAAAAKDHFMREGYLESVGR